MVYNHIFKSTFAATNPKLPIIIATEIQNIQIADGNVCAKLQIPIYMVLPRLFTCPTLESKNFKVGQYMESSHTWFVLTPMTKNVLFSRCWRQSSKWIWSSSSRTITVSRRTFRFSWIDLHKQAFNLSPSNNEIEINDIERATRTKWDMPTEYTTKLCQRM